MWSVIFHVFEAPGPNTNSYSCRSTAIFPPIDTFGSQNNPFLELKYGGHEPEAGRHVTTVKLLLQQHNSREDSGVGVRLGVSCARITTK